MAINKNKGDTVDNGDVLPNNAGDAALITRRYSGLVGVWNNPNAGSTICTRRQSYSATQRAAQYPTGVDSILKDGVNPVDGALVKASDVTSTQDIVNQGADIVKNLTGTQPTKYTGPSACTSITAASVNNIINTLGSINEVLGGYDTYFSNSVCARSCQLSCQTACQTSCQGCNVSQCHNQKCGAH